MTDFSTDGFDSLYPKYKGGRPKTSPRPQAPQALAAGVAVLDHDEGHPSR
ncbi:hypothetical protein [Streptomyces olivaceoviridis]